VTWLPRGRRRWWLVTLVAMVAFAHLLLTHELAQQMDELAPDTNDIKRMEAVYVSEIKLTAAPRAPATLAPVAPQKTSAAPRRKAAPKPAKAASAPQDTASAPVVAEAASEVAPAASEPAPIVAQAASAASSPLASAASSAAASASQPKTGPTFEWPTATKVSFSLEGNYRGPIYGQATVEWIRQGSRYQVHVDASVGPSFAPLGSWRLSSEGDITPEGLYPHRYVNTNRLLIKSSAPSIVTLEEKEVLLANGTRVPRLPGVQDPASQFVQLAYRFIMNPALLQPGTSFELPLVILKKAEVLAYDVLNEEVLHTPIGDVPTVHVKPRRVVSDSSGSLPADIWFAPGLQYLPVRILVRLDDKTFMDMKMSRAPQQVAAPASSAKP